jgi:hypothetical protein
MTKLVIPKLKLRILNILSKFISGDIVGNIPYSSIRDIKWVIDDNEYKNILFIIKKLDDSHIEKYNFPDSYHTQFQNDKAFESKYIYKVQNAYVSSRTGVIWINNNKILLESVGSLYRVLGWGTVLLDFLMQKSKHTIDEDIIVCPDTGYYHWLLEVLPNILHLLNNIDINLKIAIQDKSPIYLTTALKFILKDTYDHKVIILDKPTKVSSIYFAYYENQSGFVRKIDRDILKKSFLSDTNENNKKPKIYISRLKAPKRSIGNEQDIEKLLRNKGFEIIYAEDLNWLEQIQLYNSSEYIIAPHGAGLANIIWCKKGTKILEIFPYDNLHFCFATLAKSNNLEYEYIVCEKDIHSSGKVNLDYLSEKLSKVKFQRINDNK